jgi:1-deoxy-D-xylulose-5-phosphate reductoisomerase
MNGANEVAVAAFLAHKCGYLDILGAIRYALDNASFEAKPTLAEYDRANCEARELAERYINRKY